jgi:hypothetical protein
MKMHPMYLCDHAIKTHKKNPVHEKYIIMDIKVAIRYAIRVKHARWIEIEPMVAKDDLLSITYASEIIKDRWSICEELILKNADSAYRYARRVIKGPWPEAESIIMTDALSAFRYATKVTGRPFIEGQTVIFNDSNLAERYKKIFYSPIEDIRRRSYIEYYMFEEIYFIDFKGISLGDLKIDDTFTFNHIRLESYVDATITNISEDYIHYRALYTDHHGGKRTRIEKIQFISNRYIRKYSFTNSSILLMIKNED